jgi:hypothetical protein
MRVPPQRPVALVSALHRKHHEDGRLADDLACLAAWRSRAQGLSAKNKNCRNEMNEFDEKLRLSIELAKAGFDNAQERIKAIDTKVGVAVGLLVVLLPTPLVMVGWLTKLENATSVHIYGACCRCWFVSAAVGFCLLAGMVCAFTAVVRGISCLTPRGPRGYGKSGPFQNEWQPNIVFPLHKPDKQEHFCEHVRKLHDGVDLPFVVKEYDHQLQQLGAILHAKFEAMSKCFSWLYFCLAFYGVAILAAAIIGVALVLHPAP